MTGPLLVVLVLLVLLTALFVAGWVLPERRRRPMDAAARGGAPGRFAELSQGVTHYRWDGPANGPVVVCIHGLTTGAYVFDAVVKALTMMGFRVLRYDLYGRGLSDRPGGAQDRAFFLTQLQDLLADQGIAGRPLTLIGYSMGGSIAAALAAERPGQVERLVLIATAGLGRSPGGRADLMWRLPVLGDWLMRLIGGAVLRRGIRQAEQQPSAVARLYDRQRAEIRYRGYLPAVRSSQRHMLAEDLSDAHRRIAGKGIPVLALWGEEDAVIPPSALGRLAQIDRTAVQVSVPGAGHGLPHTHPDEVHAALQGFLREV